MEAHVFFLQLLAVLLSARFFAEIMVRIGTPSVIGELAAGIVIGPSLLGWVEANEILKMLAEIGIILLLFEVGIKTDSQRLLHSGIKSSIVALSGFIFPLLLGFIAAYWYFEQSLLIYLLAAQLPQPV